MTRLSLPKRWLEGAMFLSLDLIAPFFEDLWIPVEDRISFQSKLRELLDDLLVEEHYYSVERVAIGYRVMDWFYRTPELPSPELLGSWIRNVLVLEGPDRPGETLWTPLSYRIPQKYENEQEARTNAVRNLATVAAIESERKALLQSKRETAEDQELGEWDTRVLELQNCPQDAVVTKASLTAEYNIFSAAWEQQCAALDYAELYELWLLGREVVPTMGIDESDLPFPGSWRFELTPLMRKFAS